MIRVQADRWYLHTVHVLTQHIQRKESSWQHYGNKISKQSAEIGSYMEIEGGAKSSRLYFGGVRSDFWMKEFKIS